MDKPDNVSKSRFDFKQPESTFNYPPSPMSVKSKNFTLPIPNVSVTDQ
jgi:hypothetical protein